jgi:hypothetical protein
MSSPQVNTNPKSDQTNTNSTLTWEEILRATRIDKQHIDFAITHIDTAPVIPYEFIYNQFASDVKVFHPASIAVSGTGGVIGSVLALRHARAVKYFITTQEVLNSNEKSPLFLAKYALELLSKKYSDVEVITLELNEFEKIKMLLSYGGIYVSGLPYEITIEIAQLSGFGRLWHYSPINKKFYVF